jgi:putative flippase GtrA
MTGAPSTPERALARTRGDRLQFVRFVVAAGLSVPVNLGSRIVFSLVMPYEVAIVLSHGCGMLAAYALTKAFVFEPSGRRSRSELARFAVVNLVSVAQTWVIAVGLLRLVFPRTGMPPQPELLAHAIGLATASVTSYLGHRHYSFGRR